MIHRFLHTRSRQAYISNDNDPNCKYCLSKGALNRETIVHCFLECPKVVDFWPKIGNILKLFEPNLHMTDYHKIFGFLFNDKISETVSNYIIQNAQKCTWKNR